MDKQKMCELLISFERNKQLFLITFCQKSKQFEKVYNFFEKPVV